MTMALIAFALLGDVAPEWLWGIALMIDGTGLCIRSCAGMVVGARSSTLTGGLPSALMVVVALVMFMGGLSLVPGGKPIADAFLKWYGSLSEDLLITLGIIAGLIIGFFSGDEE